MNIAWLRREENNETGERGAQWAREEGVHPDRAPETQPTQLRDPTQF